MATINNSTPVRFTSGGVITIGGDTVLNWEPPGVAELLLGGTEAIQYKDGAEFAGALDGDERESRIRLSLRYASNAAAGEVEAKLRPAPTSGKKTLYTVVLLFPRYKGATGSSAGIQYSFDSCYCEDLMIRPGQNYDLLEATLVHINATPAPTYVTIS